MLFLEQLNERRQEEILRPGNELTVGVGVLFGLAFIYRSVAMILLDFRHQICRRRVLRALLRRLCAINIPRIVCWWRSRYAEWMREVKHAYRRRRLRNERRKIVVERTREKKNDFAIKAGRDGRVNRIFCFSGKSHVSLLWGRLTVLSP